MSRCATNVAVNLYRRGQGLPAHVDHPSCGEEIAILNLLAPTQLHWHNQRSPEEHDITCLMPNDLLVMAGDRRWHWTHEVPPLDTADRRVSVVFRYAVGATSN